jgi:hypothetical protein
VGGEQTCVQSSVRMRDGPRVVVPATIVSRAASRNIANKAASQTIDFRLWSRDGYPWVSCALNQKSFYTNSYSIYKEIGPGKRVALSKLAVEKFEETGRPLRIAIDTSIWLFQIQASKGSNFMSWACSSYVDGEQVAPTRLCAPSITAFFASYPSPSTQSSSSMDPTSHLSSATSVPDRTSHLSPSFSQSSC